MRISFFGSDEFAYPALKSLHESEHELAAVITQPDRPQGRGMKVRQNVIASFASSELIPLLQPDKLRDEKFLAAYRGFKPDLAVVCAYGRILKREVLEIPLHGCINIHPSLLPKHRGAIPIEAALMAGDKKTGVSIIYMDEGCDTGDIIVQREFPIDAEDTGGSLREKLALFAPGVLKEAIDLVSAGRAQRTCQESEEGHPTHPITKEETFISWEQPAEMIRNFIRALWPRPAAQTLFRGKIIKIGPVRTGEVKAGSPGMIMEIRKNEGPVVATGKGSILFREMKPEGKNVMNAWQFTQGYAPRVGEVFTRP